MAVNILGVISIVVFYLLILAVGLWAARKGKQRGHSQTTDDVMLAGRSIGKFVGIFTMTATWVGGAYINGTAEMIVRDGLVWCQAPFGYALSLILGGMLFAKRMRNEGYVTMLDPFQLRYGSRIGGLLYIPALMGEMFWTSAILAALGSTLSIVLELDMTISIVVSAVIAVGYTLIGGLYSVAYTDVVQLICIFIGLWLSFPFALAHEAVGDITFNSTEVWLGSLPVADVGQYLDTYLLLIFGGIPWQVYFQRVLSSKTAGTAQLMSAVAALGCVIMAVPPVLLGAIAASTDWNMTSYTGTIPIPDDQLQMTLPLTLQYLCPPAVTFLGLGAVSAAVMSSVDSSVLSAASMFSRNIYTAIFRQKASEREVLWVTRLAIVGIGVISTAIAIAVSSIYALWYLCADLVFVILFPQLLCVVFLKASNSYGSLAGYAVGLIFRLSGGESVIGLPPFIKYTFTADGDEHLFPFKTMSMLLSLLSIVLTSLSTDYLFRSKIIPRRFDFLTCIEFEKEGKVATVPVSQCSYSVVVAQTKLEQAGDGVISPDRETIL